MSLFKFLKKSKEQKAIRYAKKLRNILVDLGYDKPNKGKAKIIFIWEFDTGESEITTGESKKDINIRF